MCVSLCVPVSEWGGQGSEGGREEWGRVPVRVSEGGWMRDSGRIQALGPPRPPTPTWVIAVKSTGWNGHRSSWWPSAPGARAQAVETVARRSSVHAVGGERAGGIG